MSEQRPGRRVVVTGFGAVTPVGHDAESSWRSFLAGRSGVARITAFDPSAYPSQLAGEVKEAPAPTSVDAKEARRLSRFISFALVTGEEALARAGLTIDAHNAERVGVLVGTGIGSLGTTEDGCRTIRERGGMRLSPFFLPQMLPNMAAGQLSKAFGARAYSSTIITACAAGAQAIGEASETIRRGAADVMIAGGTEASICETGLASFCSLRALSQRNDDPERASRPFDRDRDGMVPAEGAAMLILEELEHARARGATIYAELAGYGCSSDAYHMVAPDPDGRGAALAIRNALAHSELSPDQVDYVNAHATSTSAGDLAETRALRAVFGPRASSVPISATKSMIGHSMGASGAIGAVAVLMAMRDRQVHPTVNQECPDPECDLDYVPNAARALEVEVAIANSFGFGGQNVVLAFRRRPAD
ncbi:MAG TPA: beta-ketoacyl-ACP synthase II [Chloroflexota bacterium]|jgi:3-oxoacyl-[acyl-carrier-protein] synthase II